MTAIIPAAELNANLWNTSASQVVAWKRCKRYYHFRHVKKMTTPQTAAQARGTGVHTALEAAQLGHPVPEKAREFIPYVLAAQPHLPRQGTALIEARFEIPTYPGGPNWLGFIDRVELWRRPTARIGDNKTTSDFRYNLTPDEITKDPQLLSYAWAAYQGIPIPDGFAIPDGVIETRTRENRDPRDIANGALSVVENVVRVPEDVPIELGHLYLLTRNKTPTARYVNGLVNFAMTEDYWEGKLLPMVRELVEARGVDDTLELAPNTDACGMYGGCAYRANCGLVPKIKTKADYKPETKNEESAPMSESPWLARMKAKNGLGNGAGAPPPVTTTPAPAAPVPDAAQAAADNYMVQRETKIAAMVTAGVPRVMAEQLVDTAASGMTPSNAAPPAAAAPAQPATTVVPPDTASRTTVDTREATPPKTRGAAKKAKAEKAESTAPAQAPCSMCQLPMVKHGESESYMHPANVPCVRAGMSIAKEIALAPPEDATKPGPVHTSGLPDNTPGTSAAALAAAIPSTPAQAPAVTQATVSGGMPKHGLTLLIGVVATKQHKSDDDVTLLEDWIAPLCEKVARENEVSDWKLVKFAQVADALLASKIRERIEDVPPILAITPGTRTADVAVEALSPYAARIYRGV